LKNFKGFQVKIREALGMFRDAFEVESLTFLIFSIFFW